MYPSIRDKSALRIRIKRPPTFLFHERTELAFLNSCSCETFHSPRDRLRDILKYLLHFRYVYVTDLSDDSFYFYRETLNIQIFAPTITRCTTIRCTSHNRNISFRKNIISSCMCECVYLFRHDLNDTNILKYLKS